MLGYSSVSCFSPQFLRKISRNETGKILENILKILVLKEDRKNSWAWIYPAIKCIQVHHLFNTENEINSAENEWKMESNKDDLKTQFVTSDGCYRLLNLSEYSRPNRAGYQSNQNSPQVRVSFVSLPQNLTQISAETQQQQSLEKGKKKTWLITFKSETL